MSSQVLYILGSGRSGSTILANILGPCPGIVSVGELYYIWDRGFEQNRRCVCGERFSDCDFWTAVTTRAGIDGEVARDGLRLRGELARTRSVLRSTPSLSNEFGSLIRSLYDSIAEVAGAEVVVDSSKHPVYGNVVATAAGIDTFGLLLIRDPRAVAYSWARRRSQPDKPGEAYMTTHGLVQSTAMWVVWNSMSEILWRNRTNRFMRMRYEDFVSGPDQAFADIGRLVGMPLTPPKTDDGAFVVSNSHTLSGNPVRFRTGPVSLRPDQEWVVEMPRGRRAAVAMLSLPWLTRYGYLGRRSARM